MLRYAFVAAGAVLVGAPAAAQPADIVCTIEKAYRCTAQGCEPVSLGVGLRFNLEGNVVIAYGGTCKA